MTGGVLVDRLVHQAQRELSRLQGARVVGLGRAAGADIAHLRPRQIRAAAASGKRIPIEALLGMTTDEGPHLALQVERLGLRENGHVVLLSVADKSAVDRDHRSRYVIRE